MLKQGLKTVNQQKFLDQNIPRISIAKKQITLRDSVNFSGIGLHTGKIANMTISPAPVNSGYIIRIINSSRVISQFKACFTNVLSTKLCTLICDSKGNKISTVEHILSALYGLEIDNVYIDLDSSEIPVCDGSSKIFVDAFENVGFEEQLSFKKYVKVLKKIEVTDGNKIARISPFDNTLLTTEIDFNHKLIGKQSISLVLNPEIYKSQICNARTFGFLKDVKKLRKKGLALGGSLDNAIVLNDKDIVNKGGLRYSDEFVRHKVLDLVGDLSLAGYRLLGSIFTSSGGHELNYKLVSKIFNSSSNWEFVSSN